MISFKLFLFLTLFNILTFQKLKGEKVGVYVQAKVQGKYGLKRFTRQRYVIIFINDPENEQEYFLFTCDFSVMCQEYNG